MTIHEAITCARTSAGLSEQELAIKLGYKGRTAYSNVVRYETGKREPGAGVIARIGEATGFFIGAYLNEWVVLEIDITTIQSIEISKFETTKKKKGTVKKTVKCHHRWVVNVHRGTRYCSLNCDGFKEHKYNFKP